MCQPGVSAIAKSNDTTECTDSTSGVENAARNRYARAKCRHSRSEFRQPSESTREDPLANRVRLAVAQHGDVGNEPDVEERRRHREVREIANTSHTSGLLKFGQMSRQFGYGISQKNFHGRPM